jgi:hypothetical protein
MWKKFQMSENVKKKVNSVFHDFKICHHCKNLFPPQQLITCNYNSQKMGLPIINTLNENLLFPQSNINISKLFFKN